MQSVLLVLILCLTQMASVFTANEVKVAVDGITLKMQKTNYMILSHAHYDHCGGVKDLVEKVKPKDLTLYIKDNFFKYNDKYHYKLKPLNILFIVELLQKGNSSYHGVVGMATTPIQYQKSNNHHSYNIQSI